MEIIPDPVKDGKALVTFASREERWWFGISTPFFSMEHQRHSSAMAHGLHPLPIFGNYAAKEFPQTVRIPHRVIGHVVGELALSGPYVKTEAQAVNDAIFDTSVDYLEQCREANLKPVPVVPSPLAEVHATSS